VEEKKLNHFIKLAIWLQCIWIVIAVCILLFKPLYYVQIVQFFGFFALFASFCSSRMLIRLGKELENVRELTNDEGSQRKKEYFLYFMSPYAIWVAILCCI